MKNIRFFYLKIFIFWVVKFSVYLNRHVFVMSSSPDLNGLILFHISLKMLFFFPVRMLCLFMRREQHTNKTNIYLNESVLSLEYS